MVMPLCSDVTGGNDGEDVGDGGRDQGPDYMQYVRSRVHLQGSPAL